MMQWNGNGWGQPAWGGRTSSGGSAGEAVAGGLLFGLVMLAVVVLTAGAVLLAVGAVLLLAVLWRRVLFPAIQWCAETFPIPTLVVTCVVLAYACFAAWQHLLVPAFAWIAHHPNTFRGAVLEGFWLLLWAAVAAVIIYVANDLRDGLDEVGHPGIGGLLLFVGVIIACSIFVWRTVPASAFAPHHAVAASTSRNAAPR